MPSRDRRKPSVIDLRDLGRRAGSTIDFSRQVAAPSHLGVALATVAAGTQVLVEGHLTSAIDGVLVVGTAEYDVVAECSRCLESVTWPQSTSFAELFTYDSAYQDPDADEDLLRTLEGDFLDLEPTLRDAIVPTLPLVPLCSSGCPGLCPSCGMLLADDPAHAHETVDQRWSALAGLAGSNPASSEWKPVR
jgi:uncharacterized protein